MTSIILRTATRYMFPPLLVFSVMSCCVATTIRAADSWRAFRRIGFRAVCAGFLRRRCAEAAAL